MPKISVIIPVYNVEKYIEKCVHSLMQQSMEEDIEFIFINDNTPDKSIILLNQVLLNYPKRQHQVFIIHNPTNLGIAKTRQIGVEQSKGEYIGWCDSDDWVDSDMYETMYKATNHGNTDIVVCNCMEEVSQRYVTTFVLAHTPHEVLANSWKDKHMPYGLVFHLFKRELFSKSLNEPVPTCQGEDTYLMRYLYFYAKSIRFVPQPFYHYNRMNLGSITHNPQLTFNQWEAHQKNINKIEKLFYGSPNGYEIFHTAINYLKYTRKQQYKNVFPSFYDYYKTYSECYKDINQLFQTPIRVQLKTYLVYNIYPVFWFFFHKEWMDSKLLCTQK